VTLLQRADAPTDPEPRARGRRPGSDARRFYALAATPALVVVLAVAGVPLLVSFGLSFTDYNLSIPDRIPWVGLDNYRAILSDDQIVGVLAHTFEFVVGSVVLELLVGLGVAVLLAERLAGIRVFRLVFMLPLLISWVPVAMTWRALLDPEAGWIGGSLAAVGLPSPSWVGDPHLAMLTVIGTDMWVGVPFMAVLLLTAMVSLSKDPVEAALIDGASRWQIFRYVTLPGIKPVLTIAVVFRTVDAFRQFAVMQLMTGGGPGDRTTVLNYYTYLSTFSYGRVGYGAALSVLMVVLMVISVSFLFIVGRRR
jgi:multiple sugar transport system permease protein